MPHHSHLRFPHNFTSIRDSLLNTLFCISMGLPLTQSGITRYTDHQIIGLSPICLFLLDIS